MDFVTGATGFLGAPLTARLLALGRPVRCLIRPSSTGALPPATGIVRAELFDSAALTANLRGCDTVFHFAGKAHDLGAPEEQEFRRINVEGTRALLNAAHAAGVRTFLFASSVKAMSEGGDACLDESAPARPLTAYGISKLEAEALVLETAARTGMHATVLRLPLVYGRGLKGNLRSMLEAVKRGRFPPPPDVANRRSLASVADVVNASLLAASAPAAKGRTYLVTDGVTYSTRAIYDAMRDALGFPRRSWGVPLWAFRAAGLAGDAAARILGRRMPFSSEACEKLLGSACYRNDRIREELGFTPATELRAALPEILSADPAVP